MLKAVIIPLNEEQISKLPFPEVARKIGGILTFEEEGLANHLNMEEFRRLWNESINAGTMKFVTPVIEDKNET